MEEITNSSTGLEIAVIGMAVRFPGARNIKEFLHNLKNGIESLCFFSDEELLEAGEEADLLADPNYIRSMGYLQDSDCFDAEFFGYTPAEAVVMDPQLRVFHECAWEALEDAGYDPTCCDELIGLYAGASVNLYRQLLLMLPGVVRGMDPFSLLQLTNKDNLTTWVSYNLNLKGPSYVVQTACSTSLVAIHVACQALLGGECNIALAGGVTVIHPRRVGYIYQEGMVGSPDGHCRPFDAAARGIVGGEGCGVVVLKLLEDALWDRDHIHAIIKGSAVNNDGKQKTGYTAPSIKGQLAVIKNARKMAEVEPQTIGYIEAHGTGTPLGDPIEIEALKQAIDTEKRNFCGIGSVKANFGHLDIAAGVAAFVKTVLSLKEKIIFPCLHFNTPNSKIDIEDSPFFIPTGLSQWKNNSRPLRAGVSSFGIGGTNVHLVLEEAPPDRGTANRDTGNGQHLMLISARTPTALEKAAENITLHLKENPGIDLADMAYTLQVGRRHFKYRKAAVYSTREEALEILAAAKAGSQISRARDKNRVIFMFPGFGGQAIKVNMGLELYQREPVFRQAMDCCFEILNELMGYDIKEIFYPSINNRSNRSDRSYKSDKSYINQIEIAQPVIFAFEYALVRLLDSWGITPYALIGYSISEYAAALVSGVFSLEDAIKLAVARVQLIKKLPGGAMLSVPLTAEQLRPELEAEENQGLYLAIDNGSACIVSGTEEKITAFEHQLKKRLLLCMRLPEAAYAAHSGAMTPVLKEFEAVFSSIKTNEPQIPYISNVTGRWTTKKQAGDPRHWSRHISGTVLFADGIRQLLKVPNALFIEVGPGRELTLMVRRFIKQEGTAHQEVLNLLRNPANTSNPEESDYRYLLKRLGHLWDGGVTIDWHGFNRGKDRHRVSLPTYPFQHQRYRINSEIFTYWRQILSGKLEGKLAPPAVEIENITAPVTGNKHDSTLKPEAEITDVPYAPPTDPIQEKLVNIWQRFFGMTGIGVSHDFFELGGDSLKAMNVSNLIRKELQVEIPVAEFFQRQTIEALAAYIMENAYQSEFYSIKPEEKKDYYPLSPAQKRLYFIQRMIQESTAYNMPYVTTMERELNQERLELVCQQLIQRWESYRTSFAMINEGPVQIIHPHAEFKIEYYGAEREAQSVKHNQERHVPDTRRFAGTIKEFFRPFDLSRAPLFRLGLIETGRDKYILMIDMHHIVSDGTSYLIWDKEMTALYTGEQLPELKLQYKDYSGWKNSEVRKATLNRQEEYWLKTFAGELPVVDLPSDYPRPAVQRFEGADIDFLLNEKETRIIKTIMAESEVTLYMVLLSIYTILLFKLSGQEDIVIGTPIAGRGHADLQYIIGMFVNTLAMRNYPVGEKSFNEFLAEVKDNTLKAFENQDYQFEDLVDNLSLPRNISRNPVFDFMLNLLNQAEYLGPIPEVNEQTGLGDEHREGTAKFDWNLTAVDAGERLLLNIEYSTSLYKAGTIEKAIGYFRNLVSALSADRTLKLSHLEILTAEQKQEILHQARGVEKNRDTRDTIQQLFKKQQEKTPDNTALVGPAAIKNRTYMTDKTYISYRELNERSNRLAHLLIEKGVKPDTVVGLMVERSVEMIIAVLAILKAGAAYLPIDDDYPAERKNYMLEDSNAGVLVTTPKLQVKVKAEVEENFRQPGLPLQFIHIPPNPAFASEPALSTLTSTLTCQVSPANLAYVIYTSGSTGKPKGVMLGHRNLVNLVKYQYEYTNIEFSKVLQFTTISFDVSFQEIFSTLIAGGTLVLINKETRNDIPRLFKTIEENDIKTLFLPTSYLKFVISEENYIDLMPGNVKHIVTAGEQAVITDELRRYLRVHGVYFHNHYGPTESHVVTTLTLGPGEKLPHLPSIGRPVSNTGIYIMNKAMRLVPTGVTGELVIGGIQVGRGYLNRPELTAERFCLWRPGGRFLKKLPPWTPRKNFLLKVPGKKDYRSHRSYRSYIYRTGDLGRWLAQGNIEFLGRIDYQVKIRGFRVELGEIESRLLNHPDIKEAVVTTPRDEQANIYLCAYIVSDKELIVSDLREYLAAGLPGHMVPQYFMQLERIPLNPNGKVDRKALPEPELKPTESYRAPQNEIESKLAAIWQEVLGLNREIGIDDNFFELGGHSLKATILVAKIHKIFNIRVPLAELFQTPDIRGIARYIMETGTTAAEPARGLRLEPYKEKDYYPLSSAQKRLYVLHRLELNEMVYNLPVVLLLEGEVDKHKVKEVFLKLIQRHESFRTSFVMVKGELYQEIHSEVKFDMEFDRSLVNCQGRGEVSSPIEVEKIIRDFIRPFDLSRAPLLRVGLMKLPHTPSALRGHPSQEGKENRYLLIADMHHIISDGVSNVILMREFMVFYQGLSLPPVGVRYRDYAQWQNREKETPEHKQKQAYWVRQFPGEIPVLELPIDFARPVLRSFAGSNKRFQLNVSETNALKRLASQQEVTMFMLLMSIYIIFIANISGQEDIVVGTPIAGRNHADLQSIVGVFINTLVLRHQPTGDKTFTGFLKEVRENALQAYENQEYPFEDLVEQVKVTRDTGRNPIFDTMFTMQNFDIQVGEIPVIKTPGLKLQPYRGFEGHISKFDLTLNAGEAEEGLDFFFEYCTRLFKEETIERFIRYFRQVVSAVSRDPGIKLSKIEIIDAGEKQRILVEFNDTAREYPANKTLQRLFAEQAERTPDHTAAVGPLHEKNRDYMSYKSYMTYISYRELNEKSDRLGHLLIEKGVKPDTIVPLMMERSLEMIIGILGILKAGGAYLPIDPDYPQARIDYMLKDSNAGVLVTTPKLQVKVKTEVEENSRQPGLPLQFIHIPTNPAFASEPALSTLTSTLTCQVSPANLAYIMYTSGTTGKPKGVMVNHRNVVRLVINTNYIQLTGETRILQTGAPIFDAATFETWGTLLHGGQLVLVGNDIITDADKMGEALAKYRITTLWLTSPLFNQLMRQNSHMFSGLNYLLVGGDVLSPVYIDMVRKANKKLRVINGYGPTENTTFSTTYLVDKDTLGNIPIGKPIANSTAYILDKNGNMQPVRVPGELYVGGAGLSRGYLNHPELTNQKFLQGESRCFTGTVFTKRVPPGRRRQKIYCTGDLARWLVDGNIEFLGRIDYQVKIRGFRIELEEIESRLLQHESIKEAVVMVRRHPVDESDKYLCAYIIASARKLKMPRDLELREHLSKTLPVYMIPSYFISLDHFPLNPNGKVDRKALPEPGIGIKREENYAAPRDEVEKKLVEIWREVLGPSINIGIEDNFFEIGGHSLKAAVMTTRIHQTLGRNIALTEVFKTPTISQLAALIKKDLSGKQEQYVSIEPVEKKDYYALSSAQKRMYILDRLEKESISYNIPAVFELEGKLDKDKLENTFHRLVYGHESFRTSFAMVSNEPVQRVHDKVEFEIDYNQVEVKVKVEEEPSSYFEGTGGLAPLPIEPAAALISSFIRPFDLARAPLLRVGLIKISVAKHILIVDMHHIVSDGTSMGILIRDFMALYAGRELPKSRLQYKDYARWQTGNKQVETIKKQERYWLSQFEGEVPVLEMPLDYPRPVEHSFAGDSLNFEVTGVQAAALKNLAWQEEVTLYMLLLSIFNLLLSKLSGQEDIVVGTPIAGRNHADLQSIVGIFINTLVLRNQPAGDKTFSGFLKEVRDNALQAYENQEYPFEDLVEQVNVTRDTGRNPIFDTMFTMQNFDIQAGEIPVIQGQELKLQSYRGFKGQAAKFDLTLSAGEADKGLDFYFEYCTRLFKEETIERFTRYFSQIISAVSRDPHIKLLGIEMITAEEKQQILIDFNNTAREYPGNKTLQRLFTEQAEISPDYTAAVGAGQVENRSDMSYMTYISYRELNEKSDRLAHFLIEKGVKPDTIVAIMGERSLEIIIGILGILKSGGAYLPIDPEYPQTRIDYMLKDSNAGVLVTTPKLQVKVKAEVEVEENSRQPGLPLQFIHISTNPAFASEPALSTLTSTLTCQVSPANLAYVIYTSGSTGKPKGVTIEHGNIFNTINWRKKEYQLTVNDKVLQLFSFAFDGFITSFFTPLVSGSQVMLLPGRQAQDVTIVKDVIISHRISHFICSPSLYSALLGTMNPNELSTLKIVTLAGEELKSLLVKKSKQIIASLEIVNEYGPTENSVATTFFRDVTPLEKISIGKPIANTKVYILDKSNGLLPLGVPGEICISGKGLARGYLNRPELTDEKFDHDFWDYQDYQDDNNQKFLQGGPEGAVFTKRVPPGRRRHKLYKTGDLAKWLTDGNIEFLGRIDHQVKIRGFRIEPGEIEKQLLKHHQVKKALVISGQDENGDNYLCAYFTARGTAPEPGSEELREYLSHTLPDYMIPHYFVQLEKLPLTTSGKINREALPKPGPGNDKKDKYIAPRDSLESKLAEIWAEVLNIEIGNMGIDSNFFQLGGHSLKATILTTKIHKALNIKVPLNEVFNRRTIRGLSSYIRNSQKNIYVEIEPVEKKEYYHQSSAQKRLFFLDQFEEIGKSYNMTGVMNIEGRLEEKKYETVFKALIARHESLRTSFHMIGNQPVQRIHPGVEFAIEYDRWRPNTRERGEEPSPSKVEKIIREFIRPFDLAKAPLIRAAIVTFSDRQHLFLYDLHHIINDGTSSALLINDFVRLANGEALSPLRVQYKDFSRWQANLVAGGKIKAQEDYWLNIYKNPEEIPRLNLPADYPRPVAFTFAGAHYDFEIGEKQTAQFSKSSVHRGVTLYMNLLTVFNILLYKYTDQEDIIVGSGIAGRPHPELQSIIGMFINMLALRNYPGKEKTYGGFLEEVKQHCLEAFENQDVQFEELVEKLELERDLAHNPLFDAALVVQNFETSPVKTVKEIRFVPYEYQNETSKFDLTLFVNEAEDKLQFRMEYYTKIFKRETIERLISHFINIIDQVTDNPEITLSEIDILSGKERQQVIYEFNAASIDYPPGKTIHHLLAEQAAKIPGNVSLAYKEEFLTYRQLYEEVNRQGNYLFLSKGIKPDQRVGILMGKSINRIIAVLAVLMAGGAYVPLDPDTPETRLKNIIEDARIEVLLSEKREIKRLNRLQWECESFHSFLCMDTRDVYGEEEEEKSELMNKELWKHVADTAVDEITGGGWNSSYTGEPFGKTEMDEYGDNILKKLKPYLNKKKKVLEIGCASGISMYRLAPGVGVYYGTDLSKGIIEKNQQRVKTEGHENIFLSCAAAHEIDKLGEDRFDLIIMNSVIQCFHGHNYLRQVVRKAIRLMNDEGYIFIGDVMNQDLKKNLIHDLEAFKRKNKGRGYQTKTDFSEELFVSPLFFEDLVVEIPGVQWVERSDKIYTIENELTRFRCDIIIRIDKKQKKIDKFPGKHKYQDDAAVLSAYGTDAVPSRTKPGNLAYVIYTSGTAGKPKGVMIDHRSLVNLCYWHNRYYQVSERDHATQYAGFGFDASVWEIFPYLLKGAVLHIIGDEIKLDLQQLDDYYNRHNITISYLPTQLCEQFMQCNNRSLHKLLTGGDKLGTFIKKNYHLYNNYGPTENSVVTTSYIVEKYCDNIPIGKPIDNSKVYILVPKSRQVQPVGVPGELCIGGIGVARGYLNDPELTYEKFLQGGPGGAVFTKSAPPGRRRQKIYKTGDLARWLGDGNIEFLGRIDHQVKIRGYRIELGEIESRLLNHGAVRDALIINRSDSDGDMYLCAYIVSDSQLAALELPQYLAEFLPAYMIPSYFIQVEQIPLTSNGKPDRKALPGPVVTPGDQNAAPGSETEKRLAAIWAEVLNIPTLGIHDNFFEMGGHSLKATIMAAKIHQEFQVKIPMAEVLRTPTIAGIAAKIRDAEQSKFQDIEAVEKKEYYELSYNQKRLWLIYCREPGSASYHMPGWITFNQAVNIKALKKTLTLIFNRHESFRTGFKEVAGEPVQFIRQKVRIPLEVIDIGALESNEKQQKTTEIITRAITRPFDLQKPPLFGSVLIKQDHDTFLYVYNMHHIISDGWSMEIINNEFNLLYEAYAKGSQLQLPLASHRYRDFAQWHNRQIRAPEVKEKALDYWKKVIQSGFPVLKLPYYYSGKKGDSSGAGYRNVVESGIKNRLLQLAENNNTTLFTLLFALYNLLLAYLTGEEEIVTAVISAGREHPALYSIVGYFINPVIIKIRVDLEADFQVLLDQVNRDVLEVFRHQVYPFENVLEALNVPYPDISTAFNMINMQDISRGTEMESLESYHQEDTQEAKFPLVLYTTEYKNGIEIRWEYQKSRFNPGTIESIAGKYLQLLEEITGDQ